MKNDVFWKIFTNVSEVFNAYINRTVITLPNVEGCKYL